MKATLLTPSLEGRVEFAAGHLNRISPMTGCYVISNFADDILYIGKTVNLQKRFMEHIATPEKSVLTQNGRAYWFHFLKVSSESRLSSIERGWLNQYELEEGCLPVLNKVRAPI